MSAKEIVGFTFGRWRVLGVSKRTKQRAYLVRCLCECGTERDVTPTSLKKGTSVSCGCFRLQRVQETVRKHGLSRTPTYKSWRAMLGRCYDPGNASFEAYSAKGIYVCDRWRSSFENFVEDMGMRPSKSHSIDRIDNDGIYSKENCRWATGFEQQANRAISITLTVNGETKPMAEWARIAGMQYQTLKARLRQGWAPEVAVTRPLGSNSTAARSQRAA